jgi:hypothetical protein
MRIDVVIEYNKGNIKVVSEKTNITLCEPSMVLLVKNEGEDSEKIDSIGVSESALREEMKKHLEYTKGKVFRFLDPFDIKHFDPFISACTISFYRTKIQLLHLETLPTWRKIFTFYRVDLTISIAGYFGLSDDAKLSLVKHLKMNRIFNPVFI